MKKNIFVCCAALALYCRFFTGCQLESKPASFFEEAERRAELQQKLPETPALPVITAAVCKPSA